MVKTEMVNNKIQTSSPSSNNKKMNKFKGVRMRSWGSWVSEIRAPNQKTRIWLGSYSTAEAAARAYDAALLCLKGPSANFNFPLSSSHNIDNTTIMSPKSIQRIAAAAAAANNFLDNAPTTPTTTTTTGNHPSPPPSSSTSSLVSSPSLSSNSPSNHIEDDSSLVSSFENYCYIPEYDQELEASTTMAMINNAAWYNSFDSFKYTDMINEVLFDPPPPMMIEDNNNNAYEEGGDLRLWDFC